MKYKFTVEIIGYGDNEKEAWDDAVEQFFLEPDVMPIPSICAPYLNKEKRKVQKMDIGTIIMVVNATMTSLIVGVIIKNLLLLKKLRKDLTDVLEGLLVRQDNELTNIDNFIEQEKKLYQSITDNLKLLSNSNHIDITHINDTQNLLMDCQKVIMKRMDELPSSLLSDLSKRQEFADLAVQSSIKTLSEQINILLTQSLVKKRTTKKTE
jgi:hypothetical protein